LIYKFKFEVYNDNNVFISTVTEESGDFWMAFKHYLHSVTEYALRRSL